MKEIRKYTDNMSRKRPIILMIFPPRALLDLEVVPDFRSRFFRVEDFTSVSCCTFFLKEFPFPDIDEDTFCLRQTYGIFAIIDFRWFMDGIFLRIFDRL